MVLDDSSIDDSSSTSTTFDSENQQQQQKTYTSSFLPPHIDPSRLPQIPYFNTLFKSYDMRALIAQRLNMRTKYVDRSLTGDEEVAFAEHTAAAARAYSWAYPAATAWAIFRLQATRPTLKLFPFGDMIRPAATIAAAAAVGRPPRRFLPFWDGDTLRASGGRVNLLSFVGRAYRPFALEVLRFGGFWMFGMYVFPGVWVKVLASVAWLQADLKDKRLKGYFEEMEDKYPETFPERSRWRGQRSDHRGGAVKAPPGAPVPTPSAGGERREPRDPYGQGKRDVGDLWGRHRDEIQGKRRGVSVTNDDDDASPSGGAGTFDLDTFYDENGQANDGAKESTQYGGDRTGSSTQQNYSTRNQMPRSRPQSSNDDEYGGSTEIKDGSDPSGDAWERIRQENSGGRGTGAPTGYEMSGKKAPQQQSGSRPSRRDRRRERREGRDTGKEDENEYSIKGDEEEKSYARSQAQKEFDENVEREREGGDFNDESGSGKKW